MNVSRPYGNSRECIAVVCNGELEHTEQTKERIRACAKVIGVDGGINHCYHMQISPDFVVGDFDSVDPTIFSEITRNLETTKLTRAKDQTDLEVAIERAKAISEHAQVAIFGGLGGRIDHTLGNIYLALRDPGKIFLESEQQVIFGWNDSLGVLEIDTTNYKTMALLPLSGKASDIDISSEQESFFTGDLEREPILVPVCQTQTVSIGRGEAIVVLDKRELAMLACDGTEASFSLATPIINIAKKIFSMCALSAENQSITHITPASGRVLFSSQEGQTISLVPLFGPATGIESRGLKWELTADTVSELSKHFIGISNVSMAEDFSIQLEAGHLLCIVNETLIDSEMVSMKIPEKERI